MPEALVNFRPRQTVNDADLTNVQLWRQDALDHVTLDAIDDGLAFVGFDVIADTTTSVTVSPGRFYFKGAVYYNDTNPTELDLSFPIKPTLQNKWVAITVAPKDQDTNVQTVDFEVDATTNPPTYEPQQVAMTHQRWASLEALPGLEAVSPVKPVVPSSSALVIAYVYMTPAGIGLVQRVDGAVLANLSDVDARTAVLEGEFADVSARTKTIADLIAALAAQIVGTAGMALLRSLAQDVARLKAKASMPAGTVNYRENDFADTSGSDPAYPGTSCLIMEGLRFPDIAVQAAQLQVFNPNDPLAMVSAGGLLLPAYTYQLFRIIAGEAAEMSLTQYANQSFSVTQLSPGRARTRYGAEFEEALGSSFFAGGTFSSPDPVTGIYSAFAKNGETFQIYDTKQTDAEGHEIVRAAQVWTDKVEAPYWSRLTTTSTLTAYAWVQTWLQNKSGWVVGINPRVARVPATGSITFAICEVDDNGEPDLTRLLTQVTLTASQVVANAPNDTWSIPIDPIFLESGKRYGYAVFTQADYWMQVSRLGNNAGGTLFYYLNGGVPLPDPNHNIMFDLRFAVFTSNRVSVQLQALSLPGGIAAIDILANTIVPANTSLVYEVFVNGVWYPLTPGNAGILATLPPLVYFRVTATGTPELMPGLFFSGSVVKVSRPGTAFKEGSVAEALATPSSAISIKTTLVDFDPAQHVYTAKVKTPDGVLRVPSTTTDVAIDARTTERTQTFALPAPVSSYVSEKSGTAASAAHLFHPASVFEFAQ